MRVLVFLGLLSTAIAMWNGWYSKQGTSSRLAKDGGLAALYEWKEKVID